MTSIDKSSKILWITGLCFLILSCLIIFFPRWFTQLSWWPLEISDKTGQMGDTFGGIMGPFVALLAAGLTFLAFWVQYEANQKITSQFEHERFENKFYESLKVHKENVAEININGKYFGRESFVWMYKELKFIYQLSSAYYGRIRSNRIRQGQDVAKFHYDETDLLEFAYLIFFFGVGEISKKGIGYFTGAFDKEFSKKVLKALKVLQKEFSMKPKKKEWLKLKSKTFGNQIDDFEITFKPFQGHVSKLGHYFRHLYQLIKLAATDSILDHVNEEKERKLRYEYVKQIRVQLSNHEQTMIYFNSFFRAGIVWWGDDSISKKTVKNKEEYPLSYFLDHGLIKNLPYNLTHEMGPEPLMIFIQKLVDRGYGVNKNEEKAELKKKMNDLFEWGVKDDVFENLIQDLKKHG